METDKASSIQALGLGLIFVGITIVIISGIPFLMSVFVSEDVAWDMTYRGMIPVEVNPIYHILNMMPLWAFMVLYGLTYTYVASKVRELQRWAHRAIIVMSALLPVLVCACMVSIFQGISRTDLTLFTLPSTLGVGASAAALIWYLTKKDIRVHFN